MTASSAPAIGRNAIWIETDSSGMILNKRIVGSTKDAERRFRNCLGFAGASGSLPAHFSPPLLAHDDASRVLTYRWVPGATSMQDELSSWSADGWPEEHPFLGVLTEAADRLARLHGLEGRFEAVSAGHRPPGASESPMRRFEWLEPEEFARASGGELEAWGLFQHDAALADAVGGWWRTHEGRRDVGPVHGDLRPDQFLLTSRGVQVIDWEEFGPGSRSRDLAGVYGALVFEVLHTTFSSPVSGVSDPLSVHAELLDRGITNLQRASVAVSAFAEGYRAAGVHRDPDVTHLGADIGFYLIERVVGRSMLQARLTAADRALAGVARGIILDPTLLSDVVELAS